MAQLASKSPAAGTNTPEVLYTCGSGKKATVNISITNRDASAAQTARLWHSKASTVGALKDSEGIEWDVPLQAAGKAGGTMERTAITLTSGETLFMAGSSTLLNFNVQGIEETA